LDGWETQPCAMPRGLGKGKVAADNPSVRASPGLLKRTLAGAGARCRGARCRPQPRPDPHVAGEPHGSGPPQQLWPATLRSGSAFLHQRVRFECDVCPVISRFWSLLGKRLWSEESRTCCPPRWVCAGPASPRRTRLPAPPDTAKTAPSGIGAGRTRGVWRRP